MKIINPGHEILTTIDHDEVITSIERAARTCYKSEALITPESGAKMIRNLISRGHLAMLEHYSISVKFTCDRGVSHEIVRHRIASFAQESTRYCNYGKDQFGTQITVIRPMFLEEGSASWDMWKHACETAEAAYFDMLNFGHSSQEARSVLPNSLKTEIVVTMNIREWIHFFNLRAIGTTGAPHPQMVEIAAPCLKEFADKLPEIFLPQWEKYQEKRGAKN